MVSGGLSIIFFLGAHVFRLVNSEGDVNLALGKAVEMSSVEGHATQSHYAVDGVKTGLSQDGCSATQYESYPWMIVDLEDDVSISSFFIQNMIIEPPGYATNLWTRKVAPWYWNNTVRFIIEVGTSVNPHILTKVVDHTAYFTDAKRFEFESLLCGRYVKVWLEDTESLSICEIEVNGSLDENLSDWGDWNPCSKPCDNGTSTRSRTCNVSYCCGNKEESVSCNTHACPASETNVLQNVSVKAEAINVATQKTVVLSSSSGIATVADYAVDGIKTGLAKDGYAATETSINPWMLVDLGARFRISSVFIQNIIHDCELLEAMKNHNMTPWYHKPSRLHIEIGNSSNTNTEVWDRNETIGTNATIEFESSQAARFLKIWLDGEDSLSVCELEVYSYIDEGCFQWSEWSQCTHTCGIGTTFRKRSCFTIVTNSYNETETIPCNTHSCPVTADDVHSKDVNLALGKIVKMSSVDGHATGSRFAVDGVKTGFHHDGCAVTQYESYPWMVVDLGEDAFITSFYIQNMFIEPPGYITHLWGNGMAPWYWNNTIRFIIEVGNSISPHIYTKVVDHTALFTHQQTFVLNPIECGRFVKVWLEAVESLSICEIEVYGSFDENLSTWGEWSSCSKSCGNGTTTRSRTSNISNCRGKTEESIPCNIHACPASDINVYTEAINVVIRKTVVLSSVSGIATDAHYAVDGIKTGLAKDGFAATETSVKPWLLVDLGDVFCISSIFIQNIIHDSDLLRIMSYFNMTPWYLKPSRLHIEIGNSTSTNTEVWDRNETIGTNVTIYLESSQAARFLKIWLDGEDSLSVCELEVYSYIDEGCLPWSEWSQCSRSCGNGTTFRERSCFALTSDYNETETIPCNMHSCPVTVADDNCGLVFKPHDCQDIYDRGEMNSSVYSVTPVGLYKDFEVYCDMETDKGGWIVIQRRVSNSEDFNRNWQDYTVGFGNLTHNAWLGLRQIYRITSQGHYELRIDLEDWDGNRAYAGYGVFKLGDASTNYRLTVDDYYGDAGDSLSQYNGRLFTTYDRNPTGNNCTGGPKTAWWSDDCFDANLNGQYLERDYDAGQGTRGTVWNSWKGSNYSLKKTEMKIRRG